MGIIGKIKEGLIGKGASTADGGGRRRGDLDWIVEGAVVRAREEAVSISGRTYAPIGLLIRLSERDIDVAVGYGTFVKQGIREALEREGVIDSEYTKIDFLGDSSLRPGTLDVHVILSGDGMGGLSEEEAISDGFYGFGELGVTPPKKEFPSEGTGFHDCKYSGNAASIFETPSYPGKRPAATATLVDSSGNRQQVASGSTLGVIRRRSDPRPDVTIGKDKNPYTSQFHAQFNRDAGTWSVKNISGRNEAIITCIEPGKEEAKVLYQGESAAISSETILFMGGEDYAEALIFRLPGSSGASVRAPKTVLDTDDIPTPSIVR